MRVRGMAAGASALALAGCGGAKAVVNEPSRRAGGGRPGVAVASQRPGEPAAGAPGGPATTTPEMGGAAAGGAPPAQGAGRRRGPDLSGTLPGYRPDISGVFQGQDPILLLPPPSAPATPAPAARGEAGQGR